MKFSAPISIGTNTGATGATLAITVGAAGVPAGATIFVLVTEKSAGGVSGTLADIAGNTYSTITAGNLAGLAADGRGTLFAVTNCKALVNTNTITYTRATTATSCAMSAFYVTGVTGAATFTEAVATATGTTGTITVTSGSLGAGRLVLGALFASGTSTAGGNATFTNAASFVTPPVEANTTGSGGSRVDGGTLFKAATGTQVYAPTLSSTAQQWFLAVAGIIPAPDVQDSLDEPDQPRLPAKPFDPPNLLLTTLAPPNTKDVFRAPGFSRLPDRWPAVRQEYIANLLTTTLTPSAVTVSYTFRAPFFARLPDPRPKAVGDPLGTLSPLLTPNPSTPFNQYEWRSTARIPISIKSEVYFGAFPLYSPNPPIPFNQDLWESVTPPKSKAVGEAAGMSLLLQQPFNQDLWEAAAKAWPKATGEPVAGVAPLLTPNPPRPFVQSDWYQIRSTQKAKVDDVVNLTPLHSVVVVTFTISLLDQFNWPNAALPRQKVDRDFSVSGPSPLYTPNPPVPFNQDLWDSAAKAFPKVTGEVVGSFNPVPMIWLQYELALSASLQKAKVDDPPNLTPFLTPVAVGTPDVFRLLGLARLPDAWPKAKVDDPLNVTAFLPAPVAVSYTFRSPLFTRLPDPRAKAKVDDPFNLTIYLPTTVVTFTISLLDQFNWPNPARPQPKVAGDFTVAGVAPLLTPNPARPFVESIWDSATKAYPKAGGEATGTLSPILTPNPPQPFAQRLWDLATPPKPKAYADPFAAISALYNPNPARPFSQYIWDSAMRAWPKAVGEATGGILALLAPNPANPFNQYDWTRIPTTSKARVDDFVNLIPLYTVVVAQLPFYYRDEDARSFLIARAPAPQKSDVYRGPNPLISPNPARPFHQDSWDRPAQARAKSVADVFATPTPILLPKPFHQDSWDRPTQLPRLKAVGDVLASPNPIIFPNPSRPFRQTDWPDASPGVTRTAKVDTVELSPLYFPPPPLPPPIFPGISPMLGAYPKWRMLGTPSSLPMPPPLPIPPPPPAGFGPAHVVYGTAQQMVVFGARSAPPPPPHGFGPAHVVYGPSQQIIVYGFRGR